MRDKKKHRNPRDLVIAVRWARRILKNPEKYVIIDTETTGVGKKDEVIQIAAISITGETLIDSLVKPEVRKSIPRDATAVHGIRKKDLIDAPSFNDLIPQLKTITSGKMILAYNAEFDERLIDQTIDKNETSYFCGDWDCVMLQYAQFKGNWNTYHNDYKWPKLPGAKHGAVEDCLATLKVIKKMAQKDIKELEEEYGPFGQVENKSYISYLYLIFILVFLFWLAFK